MAEEIKIEQPTGYPYSDMTVCSSEENPYLTIGDDTNLIFVYKKSIPALITALQTLNKEK